MLHNNRKERGESYVLSSLPFFLIGESRMKEIIGTNPTAYYDERTHFEVQDGDGYTIILPIGTGYLRCSQCNSVLVGKDIEEHQCWK